MAALQAAGASGVRSQGETQVDGAALATLELRATVAQLRRDYAAAAGQAGALVRTVASRWDAQQWTAAQLAPLLQQLHASAAAVLPLSASLAAAAVASAGGVTSVAGLAAAVGSLGGLSEAARAASVTLREQQETQTADERFAAAATSACLDISERRFYMDVLVAAQRAGAGAAGGRHLLKGGGGGGGGAVGGGAEDVEEEEDQEGMLESEGVEDARALVAKKYGESITKAMVFEDFAFQRHAGGFNR
jgi:hypothetical protein